MLQMQNLKTLTSYFGDFKGFKTRFLFVLVHPSVCSSALIRMSGTTGIVTHFSRRQAGILLTLSLKLQLLLLWKRLSRKGVYYFIKLADN